MSRERLGIIKEKKPKLLRHCADPREWDGYRFKLVWQDREV